MKKFLALMLSLVMVLQVSPLTVFALPVAGVSEAAESLSETESVAETHAFAQQETAVVAESAPAEEAEEPAPAVLPATTTASDHTHDSEWTAWSDSSKLPSTAGKYYLTVDVTYAITTTVPSGIPGDITLCLNGHTVKTNSAARAENSGYGEIYRSNSAACITVCDCQKCGVIEATGKTAGMFYTNGTSTAKVTLCDFTIKNSTGNGGNVININSSSASASLYVTNVTFDSCTSKAYAPVYLNSKTGTAVFTNCTFKNCTNTVSAGTTSACIYVCKQLSAVNTIDGCTFTGNTGKNTNGGGVIYSLGNLNITGSTFTENTNTKAGGAVFGGSTAAINISDSEFSGNKALDGSGGAIYLNAGAVTAVNNTKFTANEASGQGAAIHATSSSASSFATLTLDGCTFTGNKANAATIYGGTYAAVTVKDTVITGNTMTTTGNYAGALYTTGAAFTIEGSTVVKDNFNSADTPAAADFMLQNETSSFTLKDATADTYLNLKTYQKANKEKGAALGTIASGVLAGTYNWTTEPEEGVVVGTSAGTIKLMDLATAIGLPAKIKVQTGYTAAIEATGTMPADSYAAPIIWTSSDENLATIASSSPSTATITGINKGEVTITAALESDPTVTASCTLTVTDKHEHEDGTEYLPWTSTTTLPKEGNYYLTADVTISGTQNVVTGDVKLCMAGHTIKTKYAGSGSKYGELFRVNNSAYVVSVVSCEDGALIQSTGKNYGAFYMNAAATGGFYVENIKFTDFTDAGAAFSINGSADAVGATIKNCTFEGNNSASSGVVYGNGVNAKITLDGCTFTGNNGASGAAIYAYGDFTLKDCTITGNTTKANGTVYLKDGKLTISGNTKINGNTYSGGGVCDVFVASGQLILDGLGDDACIGIAVSSEADAGDAIAYAADGTEYVADKVIVEMYGTGADRNLSIFTTVQGGEGNAAVCLADLSHSHSEGVGTGLSWKGWVNSTALPKAAGNYVLLTDVTLSKASSNTVTGDVNFCLNGHTINVNNPNAANNTGYGEIFRLPATDEATVTCCNCNTEKGGINGIGSTAACFYAGSTATGSFIIDGIRFTNISGNGGCALSNNASKGTAAFSVNNCSFIDCEGFAYGIVYDNCSTANSLVLENCKFTNVVISKHTRGACIHLTSLVQKATISGCSFENCEGLAGTAIYSLASGTEETPALITIENAVIKGCKTATEGGSSDTPNGGLIYLSNDSGATNNVIKNCSFTDNESVGKSNASTAGVYVIQRTLTGSTLIDGCTFTGNKTATVGAMAVSLSGGKANVTLKDTEISGNSSENTSGNYVGAVYVTNANDKLTLAGKVVVDGNYVNNGKTERNIYLQNESTVYADGLTEGTNASITARTGDYYDANKLIALPEGRDLPSVWGEWLMFDSYGTYVKLDSTKAIGEEFYFDRTHTHCLCGDGCGEGCDHTAQSWTLWMKSDALPIVSGYYVLTSDVVLSSTVILTTEEDIHLCLNGHTISTAEGETTRGYEISAAAKLSISDCRAQIHDGVYSAGGFNGINNGCIFMSNKYEAELNIYDACFTNNERDNVGSVIYVGREAIANIYMADISNNVAQTGPVYVQGGATINIHNGYFHNNDAGEGWGGFMAVVGGIVNITGGEFYNNTVTVDKDSRRGGAIDFLEGTDINDNKVRCTVNISNAKFDNNSASQEGGAICFGATDFTLNNVTFTNNYSNAAGGAILVTSGAKGTIDNCCFAGNEGRLQAGAIQIYKNCEVTFNSGTIENNTSRSGGGIYAAKGCVLTINGGLITGNKATTANGGGVYVKECEFYMTGGTISNNYAKSYGGGIDDVDATVCRITGGDITGNRADSAGGGICFNGLTAKDDDGNVIERYIAVAEVDGANISNNSAKNAGGFVEQSGADVTFKNVAISKNTADNIGGGGYIGQYCSIKFMSGTISGNDAKKGGGGGLYIQKSVDNVFAGGTIRDNKCYGSGGGLYFMQSRAVLTGGTVSGNRSYNTKECYGGGIMIGGGGKTATGDRGLVELCGVTVKNNYALTCGGVCVSAVGNAVIGSGTTIKGNTANIASGVLVQSEGSKLKLTGGTISGNETQKSSGAGVFISTKTTFTMTGGTITGNKSAASGGGLYLLRCSANISGGTISGNTATTYGGGFYAQGSEASVSNLTIKNNKAEKQAGGGICLTSVNVTQKAEGTTKTYIDKICNTITFKNCKVYGNTAVNGGAMVIQGAPSHKVTIEGGEWYENTAEGGSGGAIFNQLGGYTINDGNFHDNKATNSGGALYGQYHDKAENTLLTINGGEFYNNESNAGGAMCLLNRSIINDANIHDNVTTLNEKGEGGNGGGVYVNARSRVTMNNCKLTDNKAAGDGGGLMVRLGGKLWADGLVITGNTADGRGGGLCDMYETTLTNTTITGNTAPEYAGMYIAGSDYDGESYYMGPYKIGGNMIIKDNNGKYTGLYIAEGGLITTVNGVLDKDTDMHINLASGVLTNTLIGQYNYEGGNLVYDVTYGDKSVTDPEPVPVKAAEAEASASGNAEASANAETEADVTEAETAESGNKGIMIAAIAVSAAAVIGGAIAIISRAKKKKEGQ